MNEEQKEASTAAAAPATASTDDAKNKSDDAGLPENLIVKVHSPFKTYYDDEAKSISAINGTGPFDILPKHHNFLTLLSACDIIIRGLKEEKRIRIARGVMHVRANKVTVFLDV